MRYQSFARKPGLIFLVFALIWDLKEKFPMLKSQKLNALRFYRENSLSVDIDNLETLSDLEIEIAFVCAGKDFEVLPLSIKYALGATSSFKVAKIILIVPEKDLEAGKALLPTFECPIDLRCEDDILDAQSRNKLRAKFSDRYGWALQQLLKVSAVITSNAAGVLIVDADTLLLSKRNWIDNLGNQILTPSWEYNASYYAFLETVGVSRLKPEHTFISHHMLMQPQMMKAAMHAAGWPDLESIVESLVNERFLSTTSPFCIEYELYGQYMWNNSRDKVRLEKWANVGLPRSSFKEFGNPNGFAIDNFKDFASLSLHAYL